eukprot:TRINITY_DN51731_c0_g1_i1.p1 TRINITY_DN51731_c0_g1~~TRINITY_DN51731_c0_g1_i1.p1  ORF type:complete len:271 (+),score=46.34 TRINITY_DN51731_c0_g1_i1:88-813(+)
MAAQPGGNLEFYSAPPSGSIGSPPPGDFQAPAPVGQPVVPPTFQGGAPSVAPGAGGLGASSFRNEFEDDFENEPPLLEELGIDVGNIILRIQGVALFKKLDEEILRDADLSGPLLIVLALGCCLLLAGKLVFGYVYGFGLCGCVSICALINMMSQRGSIDLYRTMSILGYGLLPIVLLAFIGIFVSLKSTFGTLASAACICWSTATSSRFFATAISLKDQRWLLAYPVGLVYTCFSLLTIF